MVGTIGAGTGKLWGSVLPGRTAGTIGVSAVRGGEAGSGRPSRSVLSGEQRAAVMLVAVGWEPGHHRGQH